MARWRRRHRALFIAAVVLGVIGLGLAIAQDQQTLKIRSAIAADDDRSPGYLAPLVGAGLTRGNSYDVLTNGDQIFPAMLDAINSAERRISFETYVYKADQIGEAFTTAFEQAARRGVRVNIIVDPVGSSEMSEEQVKRLRDAGCRVLLLNSPKWYSLEDVNYRTHRKILVVDGRVGFTGGAGVSDQWLGHAQDKEHWRETHVRIRGPIVRALEGAFYDNLVEDDGTVTPVLDDSHSAPDNDEGASMLVASAPSVGSNGLKRLYLVSIGMARRSIDITSPYFITDESTMWSLQDAVSRGVKVRILMEGDITDAKPVKYASRDAYDSLLAMGIELYEYSPTMLHTKVMVVDGVWSIFGSANFDNRSLELNDELNIAVMNHELAARFMTDFEEDLKHSRRIELESWRNRSPADKFRERFWSYWGEVF
jgi:cardiolipin synthase